MSGDRQTDREQLLLAFGLVSLSFSPSIPPSILDEARGQPELIHPGCRCRACAAERCRCAQTIKWRWWNNNKRQKVRKKTWLIVVSVQFYLFFFCYCLGALIFALLSLLTASPSRQTRLFVHVFDCWCVCCPYRLLFGAPELFFSFVYIFLLLRVLPLFLY